MNRSTAVFTLILVVAVMQCGIAQVVDKSNEAQVYQLPFATSGNTIELAVANTATIAMAGVKVEVTQIPVWLKFGATEQQISLVKPAQETTTSFTFAVDKTAPVLVKQTLKFVITAASGEQWTKEITVAVAPPEKFEVYQNFPNPFNPSTAISYQLSAVNKVSLKIYNTLGQEVASLVDGDRAAGYHQEIWDATKCSSGMYIYQLIAADEAGRKQAVRKRMLLLK